MRHPLGFEELGVSRRTVNTMQFSVGFYQSGPVSEAVQRAQLVESLGFDGMWLNDAQCRWRDVYVTLAAVGASTARIFLGISVTNPVTRHLTDSLVDKFALAGRPEECLERVRDLAKTGIDEMNLTFIHPNPENLLRTFAERILNRL